MPAPLIMAAASSVNLGGGGTVPLGSEIIVQPFSFLWNCCSPYDPVSQVSFIIDHAANSTDHASINAWFDIWSFGNLRYGDSAFMESGEIPSGGYTSFDNGITTSVTLNVFGSVHNFGFPPMNDYIGHY